ncbi:MAG: hypothetical protein ACLFWD_01980 [Anaerolineales bacterium]
MEHAVGGHTSQQLHAEARFHNHRCVQSAFHPDKLQNSRVLIDNQTHLAILYGFSLCIVFIRSVSSMPIMLFITWFEERDGHLSEMKRLHCVLLAMMVVAGDYLELAGGAPLPENEAAHPRGRFIHSSSPDRCVKILDQPAITPDPAISNSFERMGRSSTEQSFSSTDYLLPVCISQLNYLP